MNPCTVVGQDGHSVRRLFRSVILIMVKSHGKFHLLLLTCNRTEGVMANIRVLNKRRTLIIEVSAEV